MAINNIGKTAYIYQNGTWYAISGAANTALNYTWSGTHTYGAPVTTNDVINAKAGVNNFNNPSHRDQVLTQPVRGLVCFIAENENSVRVDQLQYFDGSIWKNISGYKTITSKLSSYTLAAADNSRVITVDSSSATTITVPANLTTAIPVGYSVDIIQLGTGSTTISPESISVSVKSKNNTMSLDGQFSKATLIKLDTNTWSLSGDIYENVAPTPTAPTPTAPTPTAPTPTAPTPTAPTPTAPTPTAPTPTAPTPTAPTPTAPTPTAPTPTAPTLSVSNLSSIVTGESTAGISWDSTGQQSFLLMVVPRFADDEPGFTLSGTTEKFASATGLTPDNVHDITLYVYSGASQTGSFQLAQSTLTTPGPIAVNTYTFTYYDGKCNYQVKNSNGVFLRNYSTNLCTNSGVDESGASLPGCSNSGCNPSPTPTAPTPTAPTPTAPTPTAPTPTAPTPTAPGSYNVTYDANGGTGMPANTTHNGSYVIPSSSASKAGYTLGSWMVTCNGSFIGGYSTGSSLSCSGNLSIQATWNVAPTPTAPTPTAPTPTAPTPTAPTPTAPTPTAPTPTAPTPTAPTPTGPICPPNSTYGVTQGGVYSGSCPDGSCPGCSNYMQSWYKCSDGTSGITFYTGLGCSTPTPTAPTPTAPTPTAPTPTAPTPTAPTPTAPTPTAPTPTAPTPTAPTPTAVTYSTSGPSLSTVTCSNGGTTNSKYVSNPSTQSISNGVCGTVSWYAYTTGTWNVGCCAS
jgi:hypothetical protein